MSGIQKELLQIQSRKPACQIHAQAVLQAVANGHQITGDHESLIHRLVAFLGLNSQGCCHDGCLGFGRNPRVELPCKCHGPVGGDGHRGVANVQLCGVEGSGKQ